MLHPFIDLEGLLCIKGRLNQAEISILHQAQLSAFTRCRNSTYELTMALKWLRIRFK